MEPGIPGFVRRFHDCLVECARSRDRDMERLRRGADRAAADLAELDDILRAYDRPAIDRRRQEAILVERDAFLEDSRTRRLGNPFEGEVERQRLHGMDYLEALSRSHAALRPRNYVEIGCRSGVSLALSRSPSIGIDPDFGITSQLVAPTRLYRMTSDEFFRTHDVRSLLGEAIDFSFIDGMHHAECALRDFINLERASSRRGVIAIDDVLPGEMIHAGRERKTQVWTGDVYQLPLILRRFRPDLVMDVFDVDLKGFCLVSRLDPASSVLSDGYRKHEADIRSGMHALPDIPTLRRAIAPAPAEDVPRRLEELARWRESIR